MIRRSGGWRSSTLSVERGRAGSRHAGVGRTDAIGFLVGRPMRSSTNGGATSDIDGDLVDVIVPTRSVYRTNRPPDGRPDGHSRTNGWSNGQPDVHSRTDGWSDGRPRTNGRMNKRTARLIQTDEQAVIRTAWQKEQPYGRTNGHRPPKGQKNGHNQSEGRTDG